MERTGVSGKSYMARAPPSWGVLSYKRIRTLKGSMYWIKKKKKKKTCSSGEYGKLMKRFQTLKLWGTNRTYFRQSNLKEKVSLCLCGLRCLPI